MRQSLYGTHTKYSNMSKNDKHFTFMESLKSWKCMKHYKWKVIDLSVLMGAAECLNDYHQNREKINHYGIVKLMEVETNLSNPT